MEHNRVTINEAFAKSNREGKDELLEFFAELRKKLEGRVYADGIHKEDDDVILMREILKE